jgi:hypothetical protein
VPSSANNGQTLQVVGGVPTWVNVPVPVATQFRGSVANAAALSTITNPQPGDVASTKDNGHLHVYSGSTWDDIGPAAGGTLPSPTSSNNGQVLQVVGGTPTWVAVPQVPTTGTANNGQVLGVAAGVPAWQALPKELPPHTVADAEKSLHVKDDGSLAWEFPFPIVVKATQPIASDYDAATIPTNAVWIKRV